MGCVSSKLAAAHLREEGLPLFPCSGSPNHVVSLTSTTYGALKLDRDDDVGEVVFWPAPSLIFSRFQKKVPKEEPDVINAWELMGDLDDGAPIRSLAATKKTGKPEPLLATPRGNKLSGDSGTTPRRRNRTPGKENLCRTEPGRLEIDPARVLRPFSSSENVQRAPVATPVGRGKHSTSLKNPNDQAARRGHSGGMLSGPRCSFSPGPLFDPELIADFERQHSEEGEQIKKTVSAAGSRNHNPQDAAAALLLGSYIRKCPPGGEHSAVLYTTTLRGIRKTYEECNAVRLAMESHEVQVVERDISMDAGYREELRLLMGKREVRVPVLFVKGRLVGGADEVLKLEEEGRLGLLLAGIPRAGAWCDGCGGIRFVLCIHCSGSCKVLDEEEDRMVRCGECNENGLIRCPICC